MSGKRRMDHIVGSYAPPGEIIDAKTHPQYASMFSEPLKPDPFTVYRTKLIGGGFAAGFLVGLIYGRKFV